MPDRDVKTIRDFIYFQYAKLIARAAFKCKDSIKTKKKNHVFIKASFNKLKNREENWSKILMEDMQFAEADKEYIFKIKANYSTKSLVKARSRAFPSRAFQYCAKNI